MGAFADYINPSWTFDKIVAERHVQLTRIEKLRGRSAIAFVGAMTAPEGAINYHDLQPLYDVVASTGGSSIDVVLESPGGLGEVAEDIVKMLRAKFQDVAFIIPGWAKSAATIIAMSGNDILMDPASSLGPIDAQISRNGKQFSAQALLDGFDKIKDEVVATGVLNKAYVPILQGLSVGELENAKNSVAFASVLVTEWLAQYKFADWATHSSTGLPVTADEKKRRASEIAEKLCHHSHWKTHGRSIKLADLKAMGLKITDFSANTDLADAVRRYLVLAHLSFESGVAKIYDTPAKHIHLMREVTPVPAVPAPKSGKVTFDMKCASCGFEHKLQANIGLPQTLAAGVLAFPSNDVMSCHKCGAKIPMAQVRREIEGKFGGKIV